MPAGNTPPCFDLLGSTGRKHTGESQLDVTAELGIDASRMNAVDQDVLVFDTRG